MVWILAGHRCTLSGFDLNLKIPAETSTGV